MHDPRLGRFFAVDPLTSKYPYNSTYAFAENSPISNVELEGKEKLDAELFNQGMMSGHALLDLPNGAFGNGGNSDSWHDPKVYKNNPHWSVDSRGINLQMKSSSTPANAVRDIFANPKSYPMDCQQYSKCIILGGMLNSMTDDEFNAYILEQGNGSFTLDPFKTTGINYSEKYSLVNGVWSNSRWEVQENFEPLLILENASIGTEINIQTDALKGTGYHGENLIKTKDGYIGQGLSLGNEPMSLDEVYKALAQKAIEYGKVDAKDVDQDWYDNNVRIQSIKVTSAEVDE